MSKAEKTKQFIVEKTAAVFNKKGFNGTSLSDMTEATGLTKGSIYGNFENKNEVAIAVYQYNTKLLTKRIDDYIYDKPTAFEKLVAYTNFYRDNWQLFSEKGGCPILNASIEADDNLPFMKGHVQLSIQNWKSRIVRIIEEGQESKEFKKDANAVNYAFTFITLIEGSIMLSKILNDPNILFAALDRIISIARQELSA